MNITQLSPLRLATWGIFFLLIVAVAAHAGTVYPWEQESADGPVRTDTAHTVSASHKVPDPAKQCKLLLHRKLSGKQVDMNRVFAVCRQAVDEQPHSGLYLNRLGLAYYLTDQFSQAFTLFQQGADYGDREAQYSLGTMYRRGQGTPRNVEKALYWYRKAAEQGHGKAQFSLGVMNEKGQGTQQNYEEAVKWYRMAAAGGDRLAQNNIGFMYYKGQGVPRDYNRAMQWFLKAAEGGNKAVQAAAQNNIGMMYYKGQGVPKDYNQAMHWFLKAAEGGNAVAQNSLGDMYYRGQGVPKDLDKAREWYGKAAEKGNKAASEAILAMEKEELEKSLGDLEKDLEKTMQDMPPMKP